MRIALFATDLFGPGIFRMLHSAGVSLAVHAFADAGGPPAVLIEKATFAGVPVFTGPRADRFHCDLLLDALLGSGAPTEQEMACADYCARLEMSGLNADSTHRLAMLWHDGSEVLARTVTGMREGKMAASELAYSLVNGLSRGTIKGPVREDLRTVELAIPGPMRKEMAV